MGIKKKNTDSVNVIPGYYFCLSVRRILMKSEAAHDKTYNKIFVTSEDSDQIAQTCSLISLHWSHVSSTASKLSKEEWMRTLAGWMHKLIWVFPVLVTQVL